MLDFAQLANMQINHELITIRRYQDNDFAGLANIFRQEFFTWFFTNYTDCKQFITEKLSEYAKQNLIMYVIIDNKTQQIIGTSSLYEISFKHKRLEMGSSWLSSEYQGTFYNALIKLSFITQLIEQFKFNRIQWKTDALNLKSQAAMGKLGFVREGVLKRHAVTYSGRVRDSVVFAVTDESWLAIKPIILARIVAKQTS